jgi:hypothetical protein
MNGLLPQPVWQIIDANGDPISGAKVWTYKAGLDDLLETYVSATSDLAASNPIVADAAGRLVMWGGADAYKLVITDADDVTIWTLDNVTLGNGSGSGSMYVVETIAALKALTTAYSIVVVLGYYVKYDGGGGTFYWDSTSTTSDDAGYTIIPDSAPSAGRYIRQHDSDVNVRFFGAKGNGSYDDKTAFTKTVAYAAAKTLNVLVPQGLFVLSDTVNMSTVQTIIEPFGYIQTAYAKAPSIVPYYRENDTYNHFIIGTGATPASEYPSEPAQCLIEPKRYGTPGYKDYEICKNQLKGLKLTCVSATLETPTTDQYLSITVDSGNCGMTNAAMVAYNPSTFTKILKASWTIGSGNAGLATGLTLTKNTWYHVFLISNKKGTVDIGFDTSLTAATLLAAATKFTYYRRIGSIYCNTDACETYKYIEPFIQYGDWFYYCTYMQNSITESTVEGAKSKVLVGAPTGYSCRVISRWYVGTGGKTFTIGSTIYPMYHVPVTDTYGPNVQLTIQVDSDSKFGYVLDEAGSSTLVGWVEAYEDIRGKE